VPALSFTRLIASVGATRRSPFFSSVAKASSFGPFLAQSKGGMVKLCLAMARHPVPQLCHSHSLLSFPQMRESISFYELRTFLMSFVHFPKRPQPDSVRLCHPLPQHIVVEGWHGQAPLGHGASPRANLRVGADLCVRPPYLPPINNTCYSNATFVS